MPKRMSLFQAEQPDYVATAYMSSNCGGGCESADWSPTGAQIDGCKANCMDPSVVVDMHGDPLVLGFKDPREQCKFACTRVNGRDVMNYRYKEIPQKKSTKSGDQVAVEYISQKCMDCDNPYWKSDPTSYLGQSCIKYCTDLNNPVDNREMCVEKCGNVTGIEVLARKGIVWTEELEKAYQELQRAKLSQDRTEIARAEKNFKEVQEGQKSKTLLGISCWIWMLFALIAIGVVMYMLMDSSKSPRISPRLAPPRISPRLSPRSAPIMRCGCGV